MWAIISPENIAAVAVAMGSDELDLRAAFVTPLYPLQ